MATSPPALPCCEDWIDRACQAINRYYIEGLKAGEGGQPVPCPYHGSNLLGCTWWTRGHMYAFAMQGIDLMAWDRARRQAIDQARMEADVNGAPSH